jgi:predicted negative regulator of RcsB-dependent stress response
LAATSDENLKAVINLRLARVQVQLKQADTALKTLETIKAKGGWPLLPICVVKRC